MCCKECVLRDCLLIGALLSEMFLGIGLHILKYKYGNRHFWARGYFVDTVGKNKKKIQEYIKNQLQQDQIADQLSLKEFVDPFTGSKETKV